mmetsp:Transcript_697/g.1497  ORF Transcript_697/g.1497 Transcript_697/m.1497 type:complete len:342 (-) Transcript_697:7-1032(-)
MAWSKYARSSGPAASDAAARPAPSPAGAAIHCVRWPLWGRRHPLLSITSLQRQLKTCSTFTYNSRSMTSGMTPLLILGSSRRTSAMTSRRSQGTATPWCRRPPCASLISNSMPWPRSSHCAVGVLRASKASRKAAINASAKLPMRGAAAPNPTGSRTSALSDNNSATYESYAEVSKACEPPPAASSDNGPAARESPVCAVDPSDVAEAPLVATPPGAAATGVGSLRAACERPAPATRPRPMPSSSVASASAGGCMPDAAGSLVSNVGDSDPGGNLDAVAAASGFGASCKGLAARCAACGALCDGLLQPWPPEAKEPEARHRARHCGLVAISIAASPPCATA